MGSNPLSKIRENEAVKKIPVDVRHWDAVKRAIWRSKLSWDIATREAAKIVEGCAHMEGCGGKTSETEPCLKDCPDREMRMSALVILNAAREFGPTQAVRPADAPYFAPTREYFVQVLAELTACHAEIDSLRSGSLASLALGSEPDVRILPAETNPGENP